MVDKINPTNQFHPYQPTDATPHTESPTGGLGGLKDLMKNTDIRGSLEKVRGLARNNSSMVLGGLAALAIGAGLMRRRGMANRMSMTRV
jgi:hypothetical protein